MALVPSVVLVPVKAGWLVWLGRSGAPGLQAGRQVRKVSGSGAHLGKERSVLGPSVAPPEVPEVRVSPGETGM